MFYFANIGNSEIETSVKLRGIINVDLWDPHTGGIQKLLSQFVTDKNPELSYTFIKLTLKPYHSAFFVEEKTK